MAKVINSIVGRILPGFDASGYELWIDGTGAAHIEERHGIHGKQDRSMAGDAAKALIPWAIQNATSGDFLYDKNGEIKKSSRYLNRNGSRAPEICLERQKAEKFTTKKKNWRKASPKYDTRAISTQVLL